MIREKSCGAVIYVNQNGGPLFLIMRMRKGHHSMCKGHVEGSETEHETARREIMEETGLRVKFVPGFRECIEYSPYKDCMKQVVFFLAEAESMDAIPQESEVGEIFWLRPEAALEVLTHESDKNILEKACAFVKT